MFIEDSEACLEQEIDHQRQGSKEALVMIDFIFEQNCKILPVAMMADSNSNATAKPVYKGPPAPTGILDRLTQSLTELRTHIAGLAYEPERATPTMRRPPGLLPRFGR